MQVADVESLQWCLLWTVENDRCEAVVHLSAQPYMARGGKQRRNRFWGVAMYTTPVNIDRENAIQQRK
jgi:hypothetical protein